MPTRVLLYASTVIRESDQSLSGYLYCIDWQAKQVIKKIPVPFDSEHPHWNARGGNRGGRGIVLDPGNTCLYLATATQILKYSLDLNYLSSLSHPYLAGLHEIALSQSGLWVTSAVHDLVFELGFDGIARHLWWGSKSAFFQQQFGFTDRPLNLALEFPRETFQASYDAYCQEEVFHVNALAHHRGALYVLSSKKRSLLRVFPDESIVIRDDNLQHPHNVVIRADGATLINDTRNQQVKIYDLRNGELMQVVDTPVLEACSAASSQFSTPGWQRGMACLPDGRVFIGSSPAQLLEVDLQSGDVKERMILDSDIKHCIHGLAAVG